MQPKPFLGNLGKSILKFKNKIESKSLLSLSQILSIFLLFLLLFIYLLFLLPFIHLPDACWNFFHCCGYNFCVYRTTYTPPGMNPDFSDLGKADTTCHVESNPANCCFHSPSIFPPRANFPGSYLIPRYNCSYDLRGMQDQLATTSPTSPAYLISSYL